MKSVSTKRATSANEQTVATDKDCASSFHTKEEQTTTLRTQKKHTLPGRAASAARASTRPKGLSEFKRLEGLVRNSGTEFFADQFETMWASVFTNEGYENVPADGERFVLFATQLYYSDTGEACSPSTIQNVSRVLRAEAVASGTRRDLSYRVTWEGGKILIDMGTRDGKAIEVTPDGWQIVHPEKSSFRRFTHMKPLPLPNRAAPSRIFFTSCL